jgi:hypothetical protein
MKTEQEIFSEVLDKLGKLAVPYMIAGSVAAIAYGEPRMTLDMDLVIDLEPGKVKDFVASFGPEYYVDSGSIKEAIQSRGHFNIIQSEAGIKIDFYLLKDHEHSREEFKRKNQESFDENRTAIFSSPEDVILKKLEWYKMGESQKHLDDIKGILKISGDKLDMRYVEKWVLKIGVQDIWRKISEK